MAETKLKRQAFNPVLSHNLVKNYPSLEAADGAKPNWWLTSVCTLTEEDATGESLAGVAPNERVLKIAGSGTIGFGYQRYYIADEPLLDIGSVVTFGAWLYNLNATSARLVLTDDGGGSTSSLLVSTTGVWSYVEITHTIQAGSTYLQASIRQDSAVSGTIYAANPMLNLGSRAGHFRPRGLRPKFGEDSVVSGVDPAGASWTDADFTAVTSPLTALIDVRGVYINSTTAGRSIRIRPNGDASGGVYIVTNATVGGIYRGIATILCDDSQIIEYDTDADAGDTESVTIALGGTYWEWE